MLICSLIIKSIINGQGFGMPCLSKARGVALAAACGGLLGLKHICFVGWSKPSGLLARWLQGEGVSISQEMEGGAGH